MKLIKCIIPEAKLEEVRNALLDASVHGMTVFPVSGSGRDGKGASSLVPGMQVEAVVPDHTVRYALDAVLQAAGATGPDSGKVFVLEVDQAVRIRTGESDDAAL